MIILRDKEFAKVGKEAAQKFFQKARTRAEKNALHDKGQRKVLEEIIEKKKKKGAHYVPESIDMLPITHPGEYKPLLRRSLISRENMLREGGPGSYESLLSPREKLHLRITRKGELGW